MIGEIKIGDIVKWWKSTYTVVDIQMEKQSYNKNFSIGTILNEGVPLEELILIK